MNDIPIPEIRDVCDCRFCDWECILKNNKQNLFLNTIKNHMKKKHNISLKTYEVVKLVQRHD